MSNSEWFEFGLIYHLRPNKGERVWGSWGEEGDEKTSRGKVARKITINLFFSKMMFSKFCYADLHWWWELLRVLLFLGWARKHTCVFSLTQLCPTLCNPMDCSPTGSSIHGIFQARILEWVAIFSSRGSSQPRDQTWVSCIPGRFFATTPQEFPGHWGVHRFNAWSSPGGFHMPQGS